MPVPPEVPGRVRAMRMERGRGRGGTCVAVIRRPIARDHRHRGRRPAERNPPNGAGRLGRCGRRNPPPNRIGEPGFAARPEGGRRDRGERRDDPGHASGLDGATAPRARARKRRRVPPGNVARGGRSGGHGLSRLIRSKRRWNRETRLPAINRDGRGVTAGQAATVVRHRARMYAHGKNVTIPRKRPRFSNPVVVVSAPAKGSTTTRPRVYANAPIDNTVARWPGSSRRFRNAVVRAGCRLQTMYSGTWSNAEPGNCPAPYMPKNAADAMRTRRASVPNSPRTRVIVPANADQIAATRRKPLIEIAIADSERPNAWRYSGRNTAIT